MEIQFMATLTDAKREERLKELHNSNTSKKADPLIALINCDPAFRVTESLVNTSSHFLEMTEMNIRWLWQQLHMWY